MNNDLEVESPQSKLGLQTMNNSAIEVNNMDYAST